MTTRLNYRKSEFLAAMAGRADESVLSEAFDLIVSIYEKDYQNAWACLTFREQKVAVALKPTGFSTIEDLVAAWKEREYWLSVFLTSLDNSNANSSSADRTGV